MEDTSLARHVVYMPLDEIPGAARNPKEHDRPLIRSALTKFGVTIAGQLDERTGRLVVGHGRLSVLEEMAKEGAEPPEGVRKDDKGGWLVPIVRGWASKSDKEAEAYVIADNKVGERGGWDDRMLAELLDELADFDPTLFESTGFNADELDDMIASLDRVAVMPTGETGARFAETDDEFDERSALIGQYADRKVGGAMSEMILVFLQSDHTEASGLIQQIRTRDGDCPAAQVVLAALRAYAAEPEE